MNGIIDVKNLSYSYISNNNVLKDINFSVAEGEIFGFLGPNGSGKSTTQRIITGNQRKYLGHVKLLNQEMKYAKRKIYNSLGVLFEYPYLYDKLSGYDNLKYFSSFYSGEVQNINQILEKLNFKMDYLHKPVSSYSKGMKQRINMARALMTNPCILFLDEPTSGLDPAGAKQFREIIKEQKKKGVTIFLTTHNMSDAEILCDRVSFIVDGEIVITGSPSELKKFNSKNKIEIEYIKDGKCFKELMNVEEAKKLINNIENIKTINTIEPTFEDVFIHYTGRKLK